MRFEGDYLNNEILMMDGEHLYLMNSSLSVISSFTMNNTKFCSSYFKFNEKYLILCDRYFLLVDGNETRAAFRHDLDISYETRNDF